MKRMIIATIVAVGLVITVGYAQTITYLWNEHQDILIQSPCGYAFTYGASAPTVIQGQPYMTIVCSDGRIYLRKFLIQIEMSGNMGDDR